MATGVAIDALTLTEGWYPGSFLREPFESHTVAELS